MYSATVSLYSGLNCYWRGNTHKGFSITMLDYSVNCPLESPLLKQHCIKHRLSENRYTDRGDDALSRPCMISKARTPRDDINSPFVLT